MDKKVASAVALHLNHPKIIETINVYAEDQIRILHNKLEQVVDLGEVREIQGQIKQLRLLMKIREYSLNIMEAERNKHGN